MKLNSTNPLICEIDMTHSTKTLSEVIKPYWGKYVAYSISNTPFKNYRKEYETLAESLGEIRLCPTANGGPLVKSRDIKVDENLYKYFASNTKQPLHTDYAYYPKSESPDWLMLYCINPSEYGGRTHLLTSHTLINIMKKYNPKLLEDIHVDINWVYLKEGGDIIHNKPILSGYEINWNYWQIKKELNSSEVMRVREEFFTFMEKVIGDGCMYDLSKSWKPGDCLIFNDKLTLHGRDAFLGERWLKDHALYSNVQVEVSSL